MKRVVKSVILAGFASFLLAGSVSAHVTVNPREATVGYSVATIRVPNEKNIPTTSIRVVVPDGVTVSSVKPVPGWNVSFARENTDTKQEEVDREHEEEGGRITEVTWTGGQIGASEFQEFPLSVQYTKDGEVTWKAYQTYQDGEVVAWDDSKGEEYPSSKIAVLKEAKVDTLVNDVKTLSATQANNPALWLSVLAVLLSLGALFTALRKQ